MERLRKRPPRPSGQTAKTPYSSLHPHARDSHDTSTHKNYTATNNIHATPREYKASDIILNAPPLSDSSSCSLSDPDSISSSESKPTKKRKLNSSPRACEASSAQFDQSPKPTATIKEKERSPDATWRNDNGKKHDKTFLEHRRKQMQTKRYGNPSKSQNNAGHREGKRKPGKVGDEWVSPTSSINGQRADLKSSDRSDAGHEWQSPTKYIYEDKYLIKAKSQASRISKLTPKGKRQSSFVQPSNTLSKVHEIRHKNPKSEGIFRQPSVPVSADAIGSVSRRSTRAKPSLEPQLDSLKHSQQIERLVDKYDLQEAVDDAHAASPGSPILLDDVDTKSDSSLSSIFSSVSVPSLAGDDPASSNTSLSTTAGPPSTAKCPLCRSNVSLELFTTFKSQLRDPSANRLSVQQQAAFHRKHLTVEAERNWAERHYPKIDWASLEKRLDSQKRHVTSVLENRVPSFYRERLRNALAGTDRRTRTVAYELATGQDGAEDVGYYGGKGQRAFGDWLIATFSSRLREIQTTNPDIVSAGGVSAFVQKVLMPELAHRLIMQDVDRNPEMAVRVKERAMERCRQHEKATRKKAERAGKNAEEIEKAVKDLGIDWSIFELAGREEEEWVGRWIAEESADIGRLVCEEEEDEILVEEEEDENVMT